MKKIMQFRFVGNGHESNSPTLLTRDDLTSGTLFQNYGPVSQLGIQGPPGLRFYLNNGGFPITIGETGIYELDFENVGRIFGIRINREDLSDEDGLVSAEHQLIIDIVYDGGS